MRHLHGPIATGLARLALLGALAGPAWAATPGVQRPEGVGSAALITRVVGSATVWVKGGASPMPAVDFVQAADGERYELADGAAVELIYFRSGRREHWSGPAAFTVSDAGGTALNGAAPRVSILPASAVSALRQVGLRKQVSRRAAVGGVRVRGLRSPTTSKRPAADKASKEGFDRAAAQQALDKALHAPEGKNPRGSARTRTDGQGRDKSAGLDLPALASPGLTSKQARHERFVALCRPDTPAGVQLTLVRAPPPDASLPTDDRGASPPSTSATVARIGEQLAFEVANLTPTPLHYVILELGPDAADGVVLPAAGATATLAPFERRRLPGTFAAAPPLGRYRYGLVATASGARWWEAGAGNGATTGPEHPSISALLRALWLGPRPAAACRWQGGEAWGRSGVDLELVAAGAAGPR